MSKNSTKSLLIIALFVGTIFTSPIMSFANAGTEPVDTSDLDADQLGNVLGGVFGMFRQFGASGEALGSVLELMFTGFTDFNSTMKSYGVFVMDGTIISEDNGTNSGDGYSWDYEPYGAYQNEVDLAGESAYFHYNETGEITYNVTEGVSVTIIIWDRDGSFIEALDTMINAVTDAIAIQSGSAGGDLTEEEQTELINLAVSTVTYFLIHINDIISGDEVIVVNTIAFTTYEVEFNVAGASTTGWYETVGNAQTHATPLGLADKALLRDFATARGDDFMLYLLEDSNFGTTARSQNYTRFSFDVIEIWLKNFHIEINVNKILEMVVDMSQGAGEEVFDNQKLTDIFGGLDIEFYIFTHHFQNWYMYDDDMYAGTADDALAGNGVPDVTYNTVGTYEGNDVNQINGTEVTDYIQFRGADWSFNEPVYTNADVNNPDGQDAFSMDWGIRADNLDFRVIPLGMKDDQVNDTVAPVEQMSFYEIGFTFDPKQENTVDFTNFELSGAMGIAKVKLVQDFGLWNNGAGPNTPSLGVGDKDLATVFMSTIFHFHLQIENSEDEVVETELNDSGEEILTADDYSSDTHNIVVGDDGEGNDQLPLAAIDIAGPEYVQNNAEITPADEINPALLHPAKTNIIPTVFAAYEAQASESYIQETDEGTSTGTIEGVLTLEFSVLLYAVSYDTFDGSGDAIKHDPTFSVFITNASPGAIAVILVVGTVALVGIAAILITKRKNNKVAM